MEATRVQGIDICMATKCIHDCNNTWVMSVGESYDHWYKGKKNPIILYWSVLRKLQYTIAYFINIYVLMAFLCPRGNLLLMLLYNVVIMNY